MHTPRNTIRVPAAAAPVISKDSSVLNAIGILNTLALTILRILTYTRNVFIAMYCCGQCADESLHKCHKDCLSCRAPDPTKLTWRKDLQCDNIVSESEHQFINLMPSCFVNLFTQVLTKCHW